MKLFIDGLTFYTPTWHRGIGKVFSALLGEVLFHNRHREIVITCFDHSLREALGWKYDNVQWAILDKAILSLPPAQQAASYSAFLESLRDPGEKVLFWHPNPLMPDQILPRFLVDMPVLLTIYDFIPARDPERYLDKWPRPLRREYRARLEFLRRSNVHIATISESVADTVRHMLPTATRNLQAIPIGFDEALFQPNHFQAYRPGLDDPYVILVSGNDARKNMEGFTEAFCRWRQDGGKARLKIICSISEASRKELVEIAEENDCLDAIEILGHISDHRLKDILQKAMLAAMPSFDEGFGLPIVEAMACGVPVVASDIPPSHEIGGKLLYYFDPGDQISIKRALTKATRDVEAGKVDRAALVARARSFNWQRAGLAYQALLETLLQGADPDTTGLKVAMLTPWPPQKSGIANASAVLAGSLAETLDLTIVTDCAKPDKSNNRLAYLTPADFDADKYDVLICQMGNSVKYHSWIYDYCLSPKALVIAHDTFIHPFLNHGHAQGLLAEQYLKMLQNHHDDDTLASLGADNFSTIDVLGFTGFSEVMKRAGKVVAHNSFGRNKLRLEVPDLSAKVTNEVMIANELLVSEAPAATTADASDTAGGKFIIGMFGFINRFKQPEQVLRAVMGLVAKGYPVELRVVGEPNDPGIDFDELVEGMALGDHVRNLGFVGEDAFIPAMSACDIVVALRHPTMGETSDVVFKAMRFGRPVIVSDSDGYTDLPDDAVVKITAAPDVTDELAARLEELLCSPQRRKEIGRRARFYARTAATPEKYSRAIRRYIAEINENLRSGEI